MILEEDRSLLLIVDVQERLAPAMVQCENLIARCEILVNAARQLGVPVLLSEQYPKGLGPTVPQLRSLAEPAEIHDKVHFSCANDPDLMAAIEAAGRSQIAVAGIEAHVCVLQSAIGLQKKGYAVAVVADAVSSRRQESIDRALARLHAADVVVADVEMVVFEWLHSAGTPEFKAVSDLIK